MTFELHNYMNYWFFTWPPQTSFSLYKYRFEGVIFTRRYFHDEEKIRTYRLLKHNFGVESYLENIHDKSTRKRLSSFRISTHKLMNERGRYVGEKPEDRLCITCNKIEDEVHFLCQCQKYENQRKILYDKLTDFKTISRIDPDELFISLMTNCDRIVICSR